MTHRASHADYSFSRMVMHHMTEILKHAKPGYRAAIVVYDPNDLERNYVMSQEDLSRPLEAMERRYRKEYDKLTSGGDGPPDVP